MRLPDPQHTRLVLIGTSHYEDENLPDLPAVTHSLDDMKAVLTDPAIGDRARRALRSACRRG